MAITLPIRLVYAKFSLLTKANAAWLCYPLLNWPEKKNRVPVRKRIARKKNREKGDSTVHSSENHHSITCRGQPGINSLILCPTLTWHWSTGKHLTSFYVNNNFLQFAHKSLTCLTLISVQRHQTPNWLWPHQYQTQLLTSFVQKSPQRSAIQIDLRNPFFELFSTTICH